MLEHADRTDRVEGAVADIAIVGKADVDPVGEPSFRHSLAGELCLARRDGDSDVVDAVALHCVEKQAAPAAADVEQAHALSKAELLADELVLRSLSLLEGGVGVLVDGTGVRQRWPEDEAVKGVRDVVVVRNRGGIAAARVPPAVELGLFRRRRKRSEPWSPTGPPPPRPFSPR